MIYVDPDRCTGCGTCEDHCPTGAINLVQDVATIDASRCTQCEACFDVCPNGAIMVVTEPVAEQASVPSVRPASEIIRAESRPVSAFSWPKAMPAIEGVLAFLGREIVPRVATYLADVLDRPLTERRDRSTPGRSDSGRTPSGRGTGGGRGPHGRHRGGKGGRRGRW